MINSAFKTKNGEQSGLVKDLLGILGMLVLLFEMYRGAAKILASSVIRKEEKENRPRKPHVDKISSVASHNHFCLCLDRGFDDKAKSSNHVKG